MSIFKSVIRMASVSYFSSSFKFNTCSKTLNAVVIGTYATPIYQLIENYKFRLYNI